MLVFGSKKIYAMSAHKSHLFEWLPWTAGIGKSTQGMIREDLKCCPIGDHKPQGSALKWLKKMYGKGSFKR